MRQEPYRGLRQYFNPTLTWEAAARVLLSTKGNNVSDETIRHWYSRLKTGYTTKIQ
jgi:hypothetical protein